MYETGLRLVLASSSFKRSDTEHENIQTPVSSQRPADLNPGPRGTVTFGGVGVIPIKLHEKQLLHLSV